MGHLLISEVSNPVVRRVSSENKSYCISGCYDGFFPPVLCVAIQLTLLKPTLGVLTLLWGILSQLTGAFAKKETMEEAENK